MKAEANFAEMIGETVWSAFIFLKHRIWQIMGYLKVKLSSIHDDSYSFGEGEAKYWGYLMAKGSSFMYSSKLILERSVRG